MTGINRRAVLAAAGSAFALPGAAGAQAAWKPDRPITIYNPLAAGGVCDVHLRFLAERLSRKWGQQIIVDVKAGVTATMSGTCGLPQT